MRRLFAVGLTCVLALGACASRAPAGAELREVFYVGGTYTDAAPEQRVMRGAMYVEHWAPRAKVPGPPLVLFSGTAQTAVNWLTTPDGREGWARYFVEQGHEVYLVDQPARGRSAWQPGLDGELRTLSVATVERLFTGTSGDWPHAQLHDQWPGTGHPGDPAFDQFYASQVAYLGSVTQTQSAMQAAGAALLDRIGPAILVTHSQAGPFGWLLADARPALVRGIVAIEPQGPPIQSGERKTEAWGVTDIALTYAPEIERASDLAVVQQTMADAPDLQRCWMQKEPAHRLPRLEGVPILVVTTEASYHAAFDHCTVRWLRQAGAPVEFTRLAERGIHGNGHMVMLEKNNLAVAAVIEGWVKATWP